MACNRFSVIYIVPILVQRLWNAIIEKVTIRSEHEITFAFKDGMELEWNIQ